MMKPQLKRKLILSVALRAVGLPASAAVLVAGGSHDKSVLGPATGRQPGTAATRSPTQGAMRDVRASDSLA